MTTILDRDLPEPEFIVRDPAGAAQEMIAKFEALTGKKLYPAQVERIEIDLMAYRDALTREAVQDAGKLTLVRYSRYPILDMLGERVGVSRLPARAAVTTMRLTFGLPFNGSRLIPAYTSFSAGDVTFQSDTHITVPKGASYADVSVTCTDIGTVGNGFVAGQVSSLDAPITGIDSANVTSIANLTTTSAGADEETDEHLRERIVLAPQSFSNAGSEGAYKFYAMSAHQDIVDVAVRGPDVSLINGELVSNNSVPLGCVYLYPLTKQGLPSTSVKQLVLQACNKSKVRPITDYVVVFDPVVYDYSIVAKIAPYKDTDTALALATAQAAIVEFARDKSAQLGIDVVLVQIEKTLQTYSIKDVDLLQPVANRTILPNEWARCISIDVQLKPAEDV